MQKKRTFFSILVVLIATLVSLYAAEVALRIASEGGEKRKHLDYRDTWRKGGLGPGGYLAENFNGFVENGFGGVVRWQNNSQGFRNDKRFLVPPPPHTYRVLSMGDSFTGGYRVGQDQTFSSLLERALSEKHPDRNIEVMTSVIEDPLTGFFYLADRGFSYAPNLVILGITLGNDIAQTYWNMGPNYRLTEVDPFVAEISNWNAGKARRANIEMQEIPSECLTPRQLKGDDEYVQPKWSDINHEERGSRIRLVSLVQKVVQRWNINAPQTVISDWEEYSVPRLFDSNGLGMLLKSPPDEITAAYQELFATLSAYKRYVRSRKLEFLVVIFPQRFQVQEPDWLKTTEVYGLLEKCFDRRLPNRKIMAFCEENNLNCLDPTDKMEELYEQSGEISLYLPRHDMHWNARGNSALAKILLPVVEHLLAH